MYFSGPNSFGSWYWTHKAGAFRSNDRLICIINRGINEFFFRKLSTALSTVGVGRCSPLNRRMMTIFMFNEHGCISKNWAGWFNYVMTNIARWLWHVLRAINIHNNYNDRRRGIILVIMLSSTCIPHQNTSHVKDCNKSNDFLLL